MEGEMKQCPRTKCKEMIPDDAVDCGRHRQYTARGCINCGQPVIGRQVRCVECGKVHTNELRYGRRHVLETVKPPPPLTAEEQRAFDRAIDDKLNARCGYGHGPVRRLSAAEIAKLAGEITPIDKVRVLPFIGFHDRRMLEG